MKLFRSRFFKSIKRCWKEISLKDKGLIFVMIILLLQCIHNLYNGTSDNVDYNSINIVIRTSVAGIFGYFLSSNFLVRKKEESKKGNEKYSVEVLEKLLEDEKLRKNIQCDIDDGNINCKLDTASEEEKTKMFCNENLQIIFSISICTISALCLIIGVNFRLIPDESIVTIAQFRDLISGCIGFLLGNISK